MSTQKIDAIVDLQFGSTGKGLIAGYLSERRDYDVVVSANMPNAGHTYVEKDGTKRIHKVLPSGVYSKNLNIIAIGPGAVFDIDRLHQEVRGLRQAGIKAKVVVHPMAALLLPGHAEVERNTLGTISSTMQGSMAAMFEKMRRQPSSNVARDHELQIIGDPMAELNIEVVSVQLWMEIMRCAKYILCEGSQGYSLGINAGFYPYCTSRDCTVWRLIADAGLAPAGKVNVIGTARVHPIRVGNFEGNSSGGHYADQVEMTWEEVGQTPETTTVTGRVRRVFSFSHRQIREAMMANNVDEVFLNFCNYAPRSAIEIAARIDRVWQALRSDYAEYPEYWSGSSAPKVVKYMGWGPSGADVQEVG